MLKKTITFDNYLANTDLYSQRELIPILKAALSRQKMPYAPEGKDAKTAYWNGAFFGLEKSRLFRRLNQVQQDLVVASCSQTALEEAFYIEKSGMTYAAKMALLADTHDKRALYSLFAADEARHLYAVQSFLHAQPAPYVRQPFLMILDDLVHEGSLNVLVYMVQVILEGWGLYHYRRLASDCLDESLAQIFRVIISDEAKHHGSGLVILPSQQWTDLDSKICWPSLEAFMELVRVGPLGLLASIEAVVGPLNRADKITLFDDLESSAAIQRSIGLVGSFVLEHCPDPTLKAKISDSTFMQPYSAEEFAAYRPH